MRTRNYVRFTSLLSIICIISSKVGKCTGEAVPIDGDVISELNDEEYYAMPRLFDLEDYRSCVGARGAYCLGSFKLSPIGSNTLFHTMRLYSENYLVNFNHTRLHRGVCLSRNCPAPPTSIPTHQLTKWFESCVNHTMSTYNLTASLYHLDYCTQGPKLIPPLGTKEISFAVFVLLLLILTTISTLFDINFSDRTKKDYGWALSWSLKSSWKSLVMGKAQTTQGVNLCCFDTLRLLCLLILTFIHVCWVNIISYVNNVKYVEMQRHTMVGKLILNLPLVVQSFFLMSSFLMAHKLLQEPHSGSLVISFISKLLHRLIRLSPSYFMVVWFATSWWERCGDGPLAPKIIGTEASYCRQNWWSQLFYLNNLVNTENKCLIQTWYLSAEMQLYALCLFLTLLLRHRRIALPVLGTLFVGVTLLKVGVAYMWRLIPNFASQNYETLLESYKGDRSMSMIYFSPLGNATSSLAGVILAFLQYKIQNKSASQNIMNNKIFQWVSILSVPALVCFLTLSPLIESLVTKDRLTAAIIAGLERPIYIILLSVALLRAINGSHYPGEWFPYVNVLGSLSYGAYLVHICVIKTILATRDTQSHLEKKSALMELFGVCIISFLIALLLALLVELPVQRLQKEIIIVWRQRYKNRKLDNKNQ